MKTNSFVTAILIFGALFTSSNKKDESTPVINFPMIDTVYMYQRGIKLDATVYTYDNQGRCLKSISAVDPEYSWIFSYNGNKLSYTKYLGVGINFYLDGTTNEKGYLTTFRTITDFKTSKDTVNTTCEYDANGFWIKGTEITTKKDTTIYECVVENGNVTKETSFKVKNGIKTLNSEVIRSFNLDKITTIGYANMGIAYIGQPDKDLVETETKTYVTGAGPNEVTTSNYTYEFDINGHVSKQTQITPNDTTITIYKYKK